MDLKILVCYYKDLLIIPENEIYFPIQCGAEETGVDLGITKDNFGLNISDRNRYWSEITGLFWAWKHMPKSKYVGLCSYRRFFNFKQNPNKPIKIFPIKSASGINSIKIPNMDEIFSDYDIILPKRYTYAYNFDKICEMNYQVKDFEILENLVNDISPDYNEAYKKVFYNSNMQIGHNMFIMKWDDFEEYCEWVFSILLAAEQKIDPSNYTVQQIRVFGYMHEILLDVYVQKKAMNIYYSQLTWLSDNTKGFKFNNIFYRLAANMYYFIQNLIK